MKEKVMEWLEDVEEARIYVAEALHEETETGDAGIDMDAEKEQTKDECKEDGIEDDPQYSHLNPEELLESPFAGQIGAKTTMQLSLVEKEILQEKTQKLDQWQRRVVDTGIKFARNSVRQGKDLTKPQQLQK